MQPYHVLVAKPTTLSPIRPEAFLARFKHKGGHRCDGGLLRHGAGRLADGTTMAIHSTLQHFAQIAQEMPTIHDLHGIRCALPHGVCVGARQVVDRHTRGIGDSGACAR